VRVSNNGHGKEIYSPGVAASLSASHKKAGYCMVCPNLQVVSKLLAPKNNAVWAARVTAGRRADGKFKKAGKI